MLPKVVIMGNGPSLRGVDLKIFENVSTFGMKNAYRHFYRVGWWPTYYGCFDNKSIEENLFTFRSLIVNPRVTVRTFFFPSYVASSKRLRVTPFVSSTLGTSFDRFGDGGNTAVNCAQAAVCLGHRELLLIGIDCNWSHVPSEPGRYRVRDLSANEDYFFDDYKRAGEVFNVPCPDRFHLPAWQRFAEFAEKNGVSVINCSSISRLDFFPRSTLEKELS